MSPLVARFCVARPSGFAGRRAWLCGLAALLLLAVAGCDREQTPRVLAPDPLPLRLGMPQQPGGALVMIAAARGLFAEQGLKVAVTRYPSGKRALRDGLLTGTVDVVLAADAPVAKAGLDDAPIRILSSVFEADNVNRVVARRDAGIDSAADLAGKTIGTQRASAVHFFWHLFSLDQGVHDPRRLRFLPAEQLPGALADGSIDAFSMREPFVTRARTLLDDNAVVFSAPGLYQQRELLVVDARVAQQRPAAMRSLLRALLAAGDYCAAQPADAKALVARELSVPRAEIDTLWPKVRIRLRLDQALLVLLEDQARWYMEAGLAPRRAMPNYLMLLEPRPLAELAPASVALFR